MSEFQHRQGTLSDRQPRQSRDSARLDRPEHDNSARRIAGSATELSAFLPVPSRCRRKQHQILHLPVLPPMSNSWPEPRRMTRYMLRSESAFSGLPRLSASLNAGPALPAPSAPHIPNTRPHTGEYPQASVPARGWKEPPGSDGHGKRTAWCRRNPLERKSASPS